VARQRGSGGRRLMLSAVARWLLRLGGWTVVGGELRDRKAVLIAAPHTSNWDGFWALVYKVAMRIDIHWFAKESLFWFPLSAILRALGGIPLDRKRASSAVDTAIEMFRSRDDFYFGLAPEGTRSRTNYWKTGFYRIAVGAGVPVVPGFLDYGRRRIGLGPSLALSGDRDKDLAAIREFYAGIEGRWPAKFGPIEFEERRAPRHHPQ